MLALPTPGSGPCSSLQRHVVLVRQSTCIAYAERLRAAQTWPIIGRSGDKRKMARTWVLSLFHALVKAEGLSLKEASLRAEEEHNRS